MQLCARGSLAPSNRPFDQWSRAETPAKSVRRRDRRDEFRLFRGFAAESDEASRRDSPPPRYGGRSRPYPNILWHLPAGFVKFLCTSHAPPRTGRDHRLQVLLREGRSRFPRPGHRGRRPQRLREVEHLRRGRLGSRRTERARAPRRADGRRHLQRLRKAAAARDGRGHRDPVLRRKWQRQRQRQRKWRRRDGSGARTPPRRTARLPRRRGRVLSERQAGPIQGRPGSPPRNRAFRARLLGHRAGPHRPGAVDEAPGPPPVDRGSRRDHAVQGEEEARRGQARGDAREPAPPLRHRQRGRAQLRVAQAPGLPGRALQGVLGSAPRAEGSPGPRPGRRARGVALGIGAAARRAAGRRGRGRRSSRAGGSRARGSPHRGGRNVRGAGPDPGKPWPRWSRQSRATTRGWSRTGGRPPTSRRGGPRRNAKAGTSRGSRTARRARSRSSRLVSSARSPKRAAALSPARKPTARPPRRRRPSPASRRTSRPPARRRSAPPARESPRETRGTSWTWRPSGSPRRPRAWTRAGRSSRARSKSRERTSPPRSGKRALTGSGRRRRRPSSAS